MNTTQKEVDEISLEAPASSKDHSEGSAQTEDHFLEKQRCRRQLYKGSFSESDQFYRTSKRYSFLKKQQLQSIIFILMNQGSISIQGRTTHYIAKHISTI